MVRPQGLADGSRGGAGARVRHAGTRSAGTRIAGTRIASRGAPAIDRDVIEP